MERRKSSQKKRKGRSEKGNTDKPAKAVVSEQRLLRSSLNKDVLKGLDATDEDDDWWDSQLKNLKALKDPPPRKTITVEGRWLGNVSLYVRLAHLNISNLLIKKSYCNIAPK